MASNLEGRLLEPDMLRAVRRRYFSDERRYDTWGAQGKTLALQEVLLEAGFGPSAVPATGLEQILNEIFPRTFVSFVRSPVSTWLIESIRQCYGEVQNRLSDYLPDAGKRRRLACEETASRFGLPVEQVEELLSEEGGSGSSGPESPGR